MENTKKTEVKPITNNICLVKRLIGFSKVQKDSFSI
jgi:hypothetical protein